VANNPKEYNLGIYVGAEIGMEVTQWAACEEKIVRRKTGRNTLAAEIFIWAWPIYKRAGSLAALKNINPEDVVRNSGTSVIEEAERESKSVENKIFPPRKKSGTGERLPDRRTQK
jgi:hypothetical protein